MSAVDSIGDLTAYNAACEGADFNWEEKAWFARDLEKALRIHERLTAAGYNVVCNQEVHDALSREVEVARRSVLDARERLVRFEAVAARSGRSLYPFQRRDVIWLASRRFALNCNQQGTGKTIEVLAALPDDAAAIVCCPSIAKGVWAREAARWRPDLRVDVLSGQGAFRYPRAGEMVVINYDILSTPSALTPPTVDEDKLFLVGDEAHFLKNKKSKRSRAFAALVEHARRAILLTGTPLPNRPEELWALLDLIGIAREAYGSKKNFVRCFNGYEMWQPCGWCEVCEQNNVNAGDESYEKQRCPNRRWRGYKWGLPEGESGVRLQRVLVRHLREEVLPDLPGKTRRIIPVDVEQNKHVLDGHLARVPNLLEMKSLEELEFADLSAARALICRLKLDAMEDIVASHEEADDPIVVFSAHRHVVDELAKRPGWAAIVGGVKNRNQIEDDFQAGKLKGIAATIQAASTAITLTRASHVYFVDLSYVPADNEQAEDRVCRIGQTRGVVVSYLVLDHPIDAHVFKLIAQKQDIIEGSVELARGEKIISEDDALALVPKLAPRNVSLPAGSRGVRSEEERRWLSTFAEICGYRPRRPGIDDKFLLKIKWSDKRKMESMLVNLETAEAMTSTQWIFAKAMGPRYTRMLDEAAKRAASMEETDGRL